MNTDKIPQELKQCKQWTLWRYVLRPGAEKPTKVPYQVNGSNAKSTEPETWNTFDLVIATYRSSQTTQQPFDGIGFIFTVDDPYTAIDVDDCVVNGQFTETAISVLNAVQSHTEFSPSGSGIHIITKAKLPPGRRRGSFGVEMYDEERFLTMTANHVQGTPLTIDDRQTEVSALHARLFPADHNQARHKGELPAPKSPQMSDQEVLNVAHSAKNEFKFAVLYQGDYEDYYASQSEADQAFCNILAFYTQDPDQIDRLFRSSGLMREKWEQRDDYREWTIRNAIADLTAWYRWPNFDSGDKGNAQRIVHYEGSSMKYCFELETWMVYNSKFWAPNNNEAIRLALTISERIEKEEIKEGLSEEFTKALQKQANLMKSERGIRAALRLAASMNTVALEEFDTDPWLFNVQNGVLDLRTGKLLPHDRKYMMTTIANMAFDSIATAPRFRQYLKEVIVDRDGKSLTEDINYLQEAIGYALTGITTEQVFFILQGGGRNGKGVLIHILFKLLGGYARDVRPELFLMKKFEDAEKASPGLAKLPGSRLVISSETNPGRRLNEALIKQLTGGDPVTARQLHKEEITFMPQFKLFLSTNYLPAIEGMDKGVWERIRIIHFNRFFEVSERDPDLEEKLKAEASGILNWLLEGCQNWQLFGRLFETPTMKAARNEFRSEMDMFSTYVDDRLYFDPAATALPTDLSHDYEAWCREFEEYRHNRKVFYKKLREVAAMRGHTILLSQKTNGGSSRIHKGFGLISKMPAEWQEQAQKINAEQYAKSI